ncbi:MAG: hypothetical protein LUH14_10690 [Clostridiaceae bacterium]|nr:hypothetical protein [Clostridiaceae bacterium]
MIEKVKKRIVQVKNLITNFGVVYTVKYIFLQVMHRDIELVMLMQGKAEQILAPVLERYNKKAIAENGAGGGGKGL